MQCASQFIILVSSHETHFKRFRKQVFFSAGRVVYQANGFLEKNKNFLPAEVIQLLRHSQYDMIRFLFQCNFFR